MTLVIGYFIRKVRAVQAFDATWEPGTSTEGHEVDLSIIPKDHYNGDIGKKDVSKDVK